MAGEVEHEKVVEGAGHGGSSVGSGG
jgi:hypothetical protein